MKLTFCEPDISYKRQEDSEQPHHEACLILILSLKSERLTGTYISGYMV